MIGDELGQETGGGERRPAIESENAERAGKIRSNRKSFLTIT